MAPMNRRPTTPPQSVANCWTVSATEARGSGGAVTRSLSARGGPACSHGQANVDAQPAALRVPEPELAAVHRDLLGDDRQAESRAPRGGGRAPREGLEQPRALGVRDPGPVVVDAQHERAVLARDRDAHAPARAPVERGVVEQV